MNVGQIWTEIRNLKGRTLPTLDRRKPFTITSITENTVIVLPQSTGMKRPIQRDCIENTIAGWLLPRAFLIALSHYLMATSGQFFSVLHFYLALAIWTTPIKKNRKTDYLTVWTQRARISTHSGLTRNR